MIVAISRNFERWELGTTAFIMFAPNGGSYPTTQLTSHTPNLQACYDWSGDNSSSWVMWHHRQPLLSIGPSCHLSPMLLLNCCCQELWSLCGMHGSRKGHNVRTLVPWWHDSKCNILRYVGLVIEVRFYSKKWNPLFSGYFTNLWMHQPLEFARVNYALNTNSDNIIHIYIHTYIEHTEGHVIVNNDYLTSKDDNISS